MVSQKDNSVRRNLPKGIIPWNKGKKRPEMTGKNHPNYGGKFGFKKGYTPWNKDIKGYTNEGSIKPGTVGEKSLSWNGGKYTSTESGYVHIYSPEHPYIGKRPYIREHRLVVEKQLGRFLLPTERVHHINKNKKDNRIENLIVFNSESAHQRFHNNPKNVDPQEIILSKGQLS